MARILGIDTSADTISIALLDNDVLLAESIIYSRDNSLRLLIPTIDYVLNIEKMSLSDIDLISVVIGPGSWSGLRIGVETAKSISYATNIPIVGIHALDALAANIKYSMMPVYCALDAKKGNLIIGKFDCKSIYPISQGEYQLVPVDSFLNMTLEPSLIMGNGVDIIKKSPAWDTKIHTIGPNYLNIINGKSVCELGLTKFNKNGSDKVLDLVPYYFQITEAEIQWETKNSISARKSI